MKDKEHTTEVVIPELILSQGELSRKWQGYFQESDPIFDQAMRGALQMTDTFGLCALACYHIIGRQKKPTIWQNVNFDPADIKLNYDSFDIGNPEFSSSPATKFENDRSDIIASISAEKATSSEEMRAQYSVLNENQGLAFAVIIDYPLHGGQDTHWLSILEIIGDIVVIAGDLSPLGMRSDYIAEIKLADLIEQMNFVLENRPTTRSAARRFQADDFYDGSHVSDNFASNLAVITLTSQ